jgi:Family of unknown function (DUF5681)
MARYDAGMSEKDPAGNSTQNSTPKQPQNGSERLAPYRFQKGKSGNASGRPKRSLGEIVVQRMLRARVPEDPQNRRMIELIVWALCRKAVKGDAECARLLFERGYGRVPLEPDFEPITNINVIIRKNQPMTIDGKPQGMQAPVIEGK